MRSKAARWTVKAERWAAKAEGAIYRAQERIISGAHGKRAADRANYGWGVDAGPRFVEVSTKVYGHGVLTSRAEKGRRTTHEWR